MGPARRAAGRHRAGADGHAHPAGLLSGGRRALAASYPRKGRCAHAGHCRGGPVALDPAAGPRAERRGGAGVRDGAVLRHPVRDGAGERGSDRVPGARRHFRQRPAVGHALGHRGGASEDPARFRPRPGGGARDRPPALRRRGGQCLDRTGVRVRHATLGRLPRLGPGGHSERHRLGAQHADAGGDRKGGDAAPARHDAEAGHFPEPPHGTHPHATDHLARGAGQLGQGARRRGGRHARLGDP